MCLQQAPNKIAVDVHGPNNEKYMQQTMGASQLRKTTAIKNNYRGLGRAVGRSQIQSRFALRKSFRISKKERLQWRRHGFGFPVRLFRCNIRRHLFLLTFVA
jgi:hypothetical protein